MSNKVEAKNTFMGLFGSEARRLLFLNFFLNPEKEFYTRELEKKLGINAGNLARELKKIEITGLIASRNVGHIMLYKANKQSLIFEAMKEIILKTISIEELLRPIFAKIPEIKFAFIYGSYARGDFDASSDIDLMVIVSRDSVKLYTEISSKLSDIEEKIDREINMDYMTEKDFFKRLKEKNPYIKDLSGNKKIFVKGGENELQLQAGKETKS